MYEMFEAIRIARDDRVLTITISNPSSRNAVTEVAHNELGRVFAHIATDRDIRVVVLTGDPAGKAFCAGADFNWIKEVNGRPEALEKMMQDGREVVRAILEAPQPIISMINGPAMGLGATLALLCDISYMDNDAMIADTHVRAGVVAGDGGAFIWPLLIGANRAKEYLMTGEAISGTVAAHMGLVNHALPGSELKAATYAMARRLAEGPRLAVEWTKRSVNLLIAQLSNSVLTASMSLEVLTFSTSDHREAVRAFLAKQNPRFGQSS